MATTALIGGIWLSLLYSATVMPASIWVIQLTVSRGWVSGLLAGSGLTLGQVPSCLVASLLLFQAPHIWQSVDLWLRIGAAIFLLWMSMRSAKSAPVGSLTLHIRGSRRALFVSSFWRSLTMPWRFPLWCGIILSISIHLRGPGWEAAGFFTIGAVIGQILWQAHFILLAGLFGKRVPEDISLRSMNKLRLLATIVLGGLAVIVLAPIGYSGI